MSQPATLPAPAPPQLTQVAARLVDIATQVAHDAEAATATIRGMTAQAYEIATLAAELDQAAEQIEASVREQAETLAEAKRALAENDPLIQALAKSIETVSSISGLLGDIAADSKLLSLNARIEASRAGVAGAAFGVVAQEMSGLANQTKSATDEIGRRAGGVARDVVAARRIVRASSAIVATYDTMIETASGASDRQRSVAAAMATVTRDSATRLDDAAITIGRVGSSATAVKLLANQIARIAAA